MKSIRALLLCAAAATVLTACGDNSSDSELKRQLEEEKAEAHRIKCARATQHGFLAEMKDCPQDATASQNN